MCMCACICEIADTSTSSRKLTAWLWEGSFLPIERERERQGEKNQYTQTLQPSSAGGGLDREEKALIADKNCFKGRCSDMRLMIRIWERRHRGRVSLWAATSSSLKSFCFFKQPLQCVPILWPPVIYCQRASIQMAVSTSWKQVTYIELCLRRVG